jgi:hypothetical protein
MLKSVEQVQALMARASTRTGLRVTVNILDKIYQTGRQLAAEVKERIRVVADDFLGKWNYRILPGAPELGEVIKFSILRSLESDQWLFDASDSATFPTWGTR